MIAVRHAITNSIWTLLTFLVTSVVELTILCVFLVTTYSVLNVCGPIRLTTIQQRDNAFLQVLLSSQILL